MARLAHLVIPGLPHHVTQRGNGRDRTFFEDSDYALYRDLFAAAAQRAGCAVWAYCLMPNHIHAIVVPSDEGIRSIFTRLGECMLKRHVESPMGEFIFSISSPKLINGDWTADLIINDPEEGVRELKCFGIDELDCILYGVKLAAVNVRALNEQGMKVSWQGRPDCGFGFTLPD